MAQTHRSSGTEAPLNRTTIGKRSMLLVGSSIFLPPGMVPDQRRIPGTLIPPSQFVDFPAAQSSTWMKQEISYPANICPGAPSHSNSGMITKRLISFPQDGPLANIKEHFRVSNKSLHAL